MYEMLAPVWQSLFKENLSIHAMSLDHKNECATDTWKQVLLHSRMSTLDACFSNRNLRDQFVFGSSMQAVAHRVTHHHFQLSEATLDFPNVVMLGGLLHESALEEASRCVKGFSIRFRARDLKFNDENFKVTALLKTNPRLTNYLSSDAGTALTRVTISHFEVLYTIDPLMRALKMAEPRKISASMQAQAPEVWDAIQTVRKEVKDNLVK
eukprot:6444974-Amphidinium_carterae.1